MESGASRGRHARPAGHRRRADRLGRARPRTPGAPLLPERTALDARRPGAQGARLRGAINVEGGIVAWEEAGYPTIVPSSLDRDKIRRYSRHLLIPEIGEEGQQRLLNSRMLLVGAGGLGSPAALYLAAAGVGTLGIVDADDVDDSNLQRQVLHSTAALGRPKVESARERINGLNPDVDVVPYEERLTSENIDAILDEGWDVIVDGADNFPTRYLVNDASVWHKIPVVHGSIYRFEGQATVFKPFEGPCYRCLFPQPPPPELAPSCAEGGVLGVLPGVIGSIQANEALKLALGIGEPLIGRLMLYDALDATFTRSPSAAIRTARSAASIRRSPSTSTTSSSAPGRMTVTVRIPPTLRTETGGEREVPATGSTVAEVLDDLTRRYPELAQRIYADGGLARFVNAYVDGEDVRTLQGLDTEVSEGSTVILLPAMAGGCA